MAIRKKVAYIDCFSGIAGDMLLAALLDTDSSASNTLRPQLFHLLESLTEIRDEWKIESSRVTRGPGNISGNYVKVTSIHGENCRVPKPDHLADIRQNQIHNQIEDHQHNNGSDHHHIHAHSAEYIHDHKFDFDYKLGPEGNIDHSHDHGHNSLERDLLCISNMILKSHLSNNAKSKAVAAFHQLAIAEAGVHNCTIDKVLFHEVGAIDSIIDTVGVIALFDLLEVDEVYCSALPMSSGTVWAAHGILPVPAPATLALMQGMELCSGPKGASGELVTPTGVALIRSLCGFVDYLKYPPLNGVTSIEKIHESFPSPQCIQSSFTERVMPRQGGFPFDRFRLEKIGVGAGTKDFDKHPNVLRVLLGTIVEQQSDCLPIHLVATAPGCSIPGVQVEKLYVIETNIDDMTAESLAFAVEQLLSQGALDAWQESIVMKKGRVGCKLCILCKYEQSENLISIVFKSCTSIGLRMTAVDRFSLQRQVISLDTPFGPIRAKISFFQGKVTTAKFEFDDCKEATLRTGLSLKEINNHLTVILHSYLENPSTSSMKQEYSS